MDFSDYSYENNGKTENFKNYKYGVRRNMISEKYRKYFDIFDTTRNGTLEFNELGEICDSLEFLADGDTLLTTKENEKAKSIFNGMMTSEEADFMGFVKSIGDASEEIISSEVRENGSTREVLTQYKDGSREIITYNDSGEFVSKKGTKYMPYVTYESNMNGKKVLYDENWEKIDPTKIDIEPHPIKPGSKTERTSMDGDKTITKITEQRLKYIEIVSGDIFAKNIGIDLDSEDGKKLVARYNMLSEESRIKTKDGKEVKEILAEQGLEPTFDNISTVLEFSYNITLRTPDELEAAKDQLDKIALQVTSTSILASILSKISNDHQTYIDKQEIVGTVIQLVSELLYQCGVKTMSSFHLKDVYAKLAQEMKDLPDLNPEIFEQKFNESFKRPLNEESLKKLIDLYDNDKIRDQKGEITEEARDILKEIIGRRGFNPNNESSLNLKIAFADILLMFAVLGGIGKIFKSIFQGVLKVCTSTGVSTTINLSRIKFLDNAIARFAGRTIDLAGPMINGSLEFGAYSLVVGTSTNIAKSAVQANNWNDFKAQVTRRQEMVHVNAKESAKLGAFAALWGTTVTSKVVHYVNRTSAKVETALTEYFAKGGTIKAEDVYKIIMEKSIPSFGARATGFLTDVVGFTGYEILRAQNALKNCPEGQEEKTLWEIFKEQGFTLLQIRMAAMFFAGSKGARGAILERMKEDVPQLKDINIEPKKAGNCIITLRNGVKVDCKNAGEMIEALHSIVEGKTPLNGKFNNLVEGKYTEIPNKYAIIGDEIFKLRDKDITQCKDKISEIKTEIEQLRKTEPEKAAELKIVLEMYTDPKPFKDIPKDELKIRIEAINNFLENHYTVRKKYINLQVDDIGISNKYLGKFNIRVKGEVSTRDKLNNYIIDELERNSESKETLLDAYNDVRDKVGCRLVFRSLDYSQHPEILAILEEGGPDAQHRAELKAAELQSQDVLDVLKDAITKFREGKSDLAITRISNYALKDGSGIPILSEAQMGEIQKELDKANMDVTILSSENNIIKAPISEKKSGYTALQINFKTREGEIIEWQFRGELVDDFAEAEHIPYDLRTGKKPWGNDINLERLYGPILESIAKFPKDETISKKLYKGLNKYYSDYYVHLRRLELGFQSEEPKLKDYSVDYIDENGAKQTFVFDVRLNANNLKTLHHHIDAYKKGKKNAASANKELEEYRKECTQE